MEQLNSVESRNMAPSARMQALEKAVYASDVRYKLRIETNSRARLILAAIFAGPFAAYMTYHTFAPKGVMQNWKASSGAYLNFYKNYMTPYKSQTEIYWPEIHNK